MPHATASVQSGRILSHVVVVAEVSPERAEHEIAVRALRLLKARESPCFFLQFVRCVDAKTGEEFSFDLLNRRERDLIDLEGKPGLWFWHRAVLDSWLTQEVSLEYKARQIGVTWLGAGYGLWMALFRPGTRILIISINLEEAQKVIARIWGMYQSAPEYLTRHLDLTKPSRGGSPSQEIEWLDPETNRRSSILALPSTPKAGHGETAGLVILDEHARQEYARESWKAAFPIIDGGGRAIIVSTANGVSTEDGEGEAQGNFFHYLWVNAESMGIERRFHGVFTHPLRNEKWYREKARRLPASDRAEMYPRTPEEGFIGTGHCWFDLEKLNAYRNRWRAEERKYLYRMTLKETYRKASIIKRKDGEWRIYEEPVPGHGYGIAADVATGSGNDFSSAHCIDLTNGRWVAEYHAKVEEDILAKDLYYAGKWYGGSSGCHGDALIAVEVQGGYGRTTVISLRDGIKGRKAYVKLYRHQTTSAETIDPDERSNFGFPMNQATRPLVINQLEQWIRDELCPWITPDLDAELRTFSKRETRPSPRALPGCNDDRVMSAGVSLELYRMYGHHERKRRPKRTRGRWKKSRYAWEVG